MRVFFLLLCALPLFAEGGIQGIPPWPNQYGSELITDGDLESLTNWTVDSCAAGDTGTGVGGSDSVAITGNCNGIEQNFTSPDVSAYPWIAVTVWVKKAASTDYELTISLRDQTDGAGFAPVNSSWDTEFSQSGSGRVTDGTVVSSGDYIRIYRLFSVAETHGSESFRLELNSAGGAGGTLYLDDVSVKGANYPLYNFVKYPSYEGYHWSGYTSRFCSTYAECAAGFVDVRPSGTLASVYVNILFDTTAGCASPTSTTRIDPTVQRTDWEIDVSSMADDDTAYICAELRLDADDSLVASFPDWKIIQRTTAWRTSNIRHWIDDYGTWVDGTQRQFLFQTYVRTTGYNADPCTTCTSSADYLSMLGIKRNTTMLNALRSSGRNAVMYFSPFSGANPDNGGASDQVGTFGDAASAVGLNWWYLVSAMYGTQIGLDEDVAANAASAPTIVCSSSGGSISDANVYVKVSGVGGRNTLEQTRFLIETEGSASDHETGLTGSTNSCVVTVPACEGAVAAYWVYAAGAGTESEPSNSSYSLQDTAPISCGTDFDLTAISTGNKAPNTTSSGGDYGNVPSFSSRTSWIPTNETFKNGIDELEIATSGQQSFLGYYMGDEVTPYDIVWNYAIQDYIRTNYPGRLNFSLVLQARSPAGVDWFFSPVVDVNAQDLYYEGQSGSPEDDQALNGVSTGRAATCYAYAGLNSTSSFNYANLNKIDEWVDAKMQSHEGSRMNLPVVMQFGRFTTTCYGWTEDELRKEIWHSIVAVQNWGVIGGVGTWGWVSSSGLDRMARLPSGVLDNSPSGESRGITQSYEDDVKVGAELMAIEDVLIQPIDDSTELGFGTVLDGAPTSSISLPTSTCTLLGSPVPIRTVAKQMDDGSQWIFAANLCPDSQTATLSLAAKPAGAVATDYFTGATLTIDGSDDIDVSMSDFSVHVIRVATPEGGGIKGRE